MALTDKALEEMLNADGWPVERLDANTWRSAFRVGEERFRFFVRLAPNWVFLTILPFVVAPDDEEAALILFRRLLELNREITLAKLALERNDVVLTVELPSENLVFSQLKDGLDALSFYAGLHFAELSALAAPPQLAN